MALQTALGLGAQGFFIPYRYAAGVRKPAAYAALEQVFARADAQFTQTLELIGQYEPALAQIGQSAPAPQPRWGQSWFPGYDGAAAYALTRAARPGRIVEVGSGHSTRFLARALADEGVKADHVAIDPAPRAPMLSLDVRWRNELLAEDHAPLFEALNPGDMAVFDSSHILMPGTDVDIIYNRLLPILKPGVRVHIHDILLPDPYPEAWAWRGYNEQNALGPLLASGGWKIVFSSWYARTRMDEIARKACPNAPRPPQGAFETSLWLEKL